MFHFQTLDVYERAIAFYQPRTTSAGYELLHRVVSMLTKMITNLR